MKKILARFLLVSIAIVVVACTSAQDHEPDLIKLATISNAPGIIGEMRDDGLFLIVNNDAQGKYLVDVRARSIIYQVNEAEFLSIDLEDRYALHYGFGIQEKFIDLETGVVVDEIEELPPPSNKPYYVIRTEEEDEAPSQTSVIETSTGNVVFHREDSHWISFSPEQHYLIITALHETPPEVILLDLITGQTHHTFVAPSDIPEGAIGRTIAPYFTEHSDLFFIYWGFVGTTQIIDFESGEVQYEFTGHIQLTPNRRFVIANNHAGYSDVQVYDLSTGELVYEVFGGAIYSSITGRYLYIKEGYDVADVQVIDTESNEIIYEARGWFSPTFLNNDTQLALWNVGERKVRIVDLNSGNVVHELGEGQWLSSSSCYPYYIIENIDGRSGVALVDEDFEYVVPTASQIEFSPDCNLIFASDGTSIDVYGKPELQSLFE